MAYGDRKRDHGPETLSWWGGTVPGTKVTLSANTYVGNHFQFDTPGNVWGFRYCQEAGHSDECWFLFWDTSSPGILAAKNFRSQPGLSADGWVNVWVHPVIPVVASTDYFVAVLGKGRYFRHTGGGGGSGVTVNHITLIGGFQSTAIDPPAVTITFNTNQNGVDILFRPS